MQTVIGVFDSVDEAQSARESLLSAGFESSELRVQSSSELENGDQAASSNRSMTGTTATTSKSSDDEGFMASVGRFFGDLFGSGDTEQAGHYSEAVRRGSTVLTVTLADDSRVEQARSALAAAGAVDIDKRTESWKQDGYEGFDPASAPYKSEQIAAERSRNQGQMNMLKQPASSTASDTVQTSQVADGTVLPVIREELEVSKREADLGTVRVVSRTETRPVEEQVQLREERAEIERRAIDRPATEADLKAFEGGSIEIHETAERAVVSKQARVVEEVVVGTAANVRTETISDQVRNTVVEVDKSQASAGMTAQASPDYRTHYQANMASMGGTYEDHEPAYKYGSEMRSDPRYASRSWTDVEADAQSDWTSRNTGGSSTWEKSKQAVKHGWESMTGRR